MGRARKKLSPDEWNEVWDLFDQCARLDEAARARLLDEQGTSRAWLRAEVESLIENAPMADGALETSLLTQMAASAHAAASDPPPDAGERFQPQRLGKYLLMHRLGRGGMAEVFLAKSTGPRGFERWIAVKRVRPEYAADPSVRSYFDHEARLNSRLNHGNIVHIYDFGEYDGAYFLAMEFVNGKNLSEVLKRVRRTGSAIPLDVALYVTARVADALDYAHHRRDDLTGEALGIIHRDITPRNIMVSFEGIVKVVDFGIAKSHDRTSYTIAGNIRGTLGYLSPEMAGGQPVDARSDVFSLTAILYEMLAGQRLLPTEDWLAFLSQIQDPQFIPGRLGTLPADPRLAAVLARGLAYRPESRPSAAELRNQLDSIQDSAAAGELPKRVAQFLETLFPGERDRPRNLIEANPAVAPTGAQPVRRIAFHRPWQTRSLAVALTAIATAILCLVGTLWKVNARAVATLDQPLSRTPPAIAEACRTDTSRVCPGLKWGEGLAGCLTGNASSLSAGCSQALFKRPCSRFYYTYCVEAKGPRAIHACLLDHWDQLSDECRQSETRHEN
jgi:serine/threonine protein kinase